MKLLKRVGGWDCANANGSNVKHSPLIADPSCPNVPKLVISRGNNKTRMGL